MCPVGAPPAMTASKSNASHAVGLATSNINADRERTPAQAAGS